MRTVAEIAIRAAKGYGQDNCAVFSAGVTYFALLSLFPLTLFAISVTGFFFQEADEQARLVENMLDALPIDESSGRDDLEDLIRSVVDARGTLGVIGLLGSAYSASALFGAVRTALNAVVKAERKRPFFLGKAVDLLQVVVFTVLLLLSVTVTFAIALAQRFSGELFGEEAATWTARLLTLTYALVPTAVSALGFFLVFTFVPARRLGIRHTVWGAVVAAVLFEILKILFTQYVTNFGNYNATYGTLGFVIVLLVFFNFSAQILLVGAEVARAGADMPPAGEERFAQSDAARAKVNGLLAKIPVAGRRFATPAPEVAADAPIGPLEASLAVDIAEEAPAPMRRGRDGNASLAAWLLALGVLIGALVRLRRR